LELKQATRLIHQKQRDISAPAEIKEAGSIDRFYHLVYLKNRIAAHEAAVKDDDKKLANAARAKKQEIARELWVEEARKRVLVVVTNAEP
jgi:cyclopropane fatty-acyl-phospholipid synthase-like methyltransferase